MKKGFQKEHKIGITAIICLLIGALAAFVFMYFNGNKIYIREKTDDAVYSQKYSNKNKKDTFKTNERAKRYNVFNYYYQKDGKQMAKTKEQTDNLLTQIPEGFYKIEKTKNENLILDLNNCDTLDLQMIRGIGPAYSRRIFNYREKLGGYVSVGQLKEVYGMSDSLYQQIEKHFIIGEKSIRKVNINSTNIKEIAAHPYIDWYLAKEIIIFHQNHGSFSDIEQLRLVHLMSDSLFEKLKPYVDIR